jgi:nicotinamide-nucleotide adenylyltransferase
MTRALLVGRFQPFHIGHLEVIKEIASQVEKLIIGIGSAQASHTQEDPFTAGERHLMMSEALDEAKIKNYYIIPIMDLNRYKIWVAHVMSLVPPFDVIFTNNNLTATLFEEAGFEVRRPKLYDRSRYSGKVIRKLMAEGGDWRSLVPEASAKVIDGFDGEKRIRTLYSGGST